MTKDNEEKIHTTIRILKWIKTMAKPVYLMLISSEQANTKYRRYVLAWQYMTNLL